MKKNEVIIKLNVEECYRQKKSHFNEVAKRYVLNLCYLRPCKLKVQTVSNLLDYV